MRTRKHPRMYLIANVIALRGVNADDFAAWDADALGGGTITVRSGTMVDVRAAAAVAGLSPAAADELIDEYSA